MQQQRQPPSHRIPNVAQNGIPNPQLPLPHAPVVAQQQPQNRNSPVLPQQQMYVQNWLQQQQQFAIQQQHLQCMQQQQQLLTSPTTINTTNPSTTSSGGTTPSAPANPKISLAQPAQKKQATTSLTSNPSSPNINNNSVSKSSFKPIVNNNNNKMNRSAESKKPHFVPLTPSQALLASAQRKIAQENGELLPIDGSSLTTCLSRTFETAKEHNNQGKGPIILKNSNTSSTAAAARTCPKTNSPCTSGKTSCSNHIKAENRSTQLEAGAFSVTINGEVHTLDAVDPTMTLNEYVRSLPGLTGTKRSCAEGGCGVCTVGFVAPSADPSSAPVSINSCIKPLAACNGAIVTTVEGLQKEGGNASEISKRLADFNGTQCGFCSPGFVMNMFSLLSQYPDGSLPSAEQVENYFDGNLCRCTGYRPIFDAFKSFSSDQLQGTLPSSDRTLLRQCLPDIEEIPCPGKTAALKRRDPFVLKTACNKNNSRSSRVLPTNRIKTTDANVTWVVPQTLDELFEFISQAPVDPFLVGGLTSQGVYKNQDPTYLIDLQYVPELHGDSLTSTELSVGGATSIAGFLDLVESVSGSSATFTALLELVRRVASTQIRHAGTIAGNLMLVHKFNFVSDLFVALLGAGATLSLMTDATSQPTIVDLLTFLQTDMTKTVIASINLPLVSASSPSVVIAQTQKTALRHTNAHSLVNSSMVACVDTSSNKLVAGSTTLAVGGLATQPVRFSNTEAVLNGGLDVTSAADFQTALASFANEAATLVDTTVARQPYRLWLATAYFYKFWLSLVPPSVLPARLLSATQKYQRPVSVGQQNYQPTNTATYPVSQPLPKVDGFEQTSGKAIYIPDISPARDTLYAAFVLSTVASATLESIDPSPALALDGVVDFLSANDIKGMNALPSGTELFVSSQVKYAGQALGIVLATSQKLANAAAALVVVNYTNVQTPILTLDDAISQSSFYPIPPEQLLPINVGDVNTGFANSDVILEGTIEMGAQYHFHMETQACVASPSDEAVGYLKVFSSTQMPATTLPVLSAILGVPNNMIEVRNKRLGGAYGGKLTNAVPVAAAVCIASQKHNRTVSINMDLESNMRMLGKRNPVRASYKVGVSSDGTLQALELHSYTDAGCGVSDTFISAIIFQQNVDNAYMIPNFLADAKVCFTNTPANTSVRAPGWAQATFTMEHIMEHVASSLSLPVDQVKEKNFYQKNQVTPDGYQLKYWDLDTIWSQLKQTSDYDNRVQEVVAYNQANRWTKRGIAIVPVKFEVSHVGAFHSVLTSILPDGSVQVTTSGVEMGQGLTTKVAQTVAYALGLPDTSLIRVLTTSTVTNPNTAPTGGSIGSELCCAAALESCHQLNQTMAAVRSSLGPGAPWTKIVSSALAVGLNLQAIGWFNPMSKYPIPGNANTYNSYSAAVSQVFVDVLTGDVQIERCDILFDCGQSLSPLIDVGQIEGAFTMGLGFMLSEEMIYDTDDQSPTYGQLLTDGTWEYKPPAALDIPLDLRVTLLPNAPNPVGVLSSKVTGEPPLCSAASALFAVQHAVADARAERGVTNYFQLNAPATVEFTLIATGVGVSDLNITG